MIFMATETLKIKYIKDKDNNRILPVTHETAVIDSNGINLASKLEDLNRTVVLNHGTSDTEIQLTPNILHKWDMITNLTLTFPNDVDGYCNEFKVVFMAGANFSLSVPSTMYWNNGITPEFEEGKIYEMNIFDSRILINMFNTVE